MIVLLWCLGFGMAGMIGVALGGSFVKERGRRVLPIVVIATIAAGALIGWALAGEYAAFVAPSLSGATTRVRLREAAPRQGSG